MGGGSNELPPHIFLKFFFYKGNFEAEHKKNHLMGGLKVVIIEFVSAFIYVN